METTASTLHIERTASYPARYFAAWNQRDIDVALAVVAPNFWWTDPSLPAPLTDHEGARGFFTVAWQAFPDLHFEAIGAPLVDSAGRVAHEWVMTGTHLGEGFPPGASPSGRHFEVPGSDVFEVDPEGRAIGVRAYYDVAGFARQLGLA